MNSCLSVPALHKPDGITSKTFAGHGNICSYSHSVVEDHIDGYKLVGHFAVKAGQFAAPERSREDVTFDHPGFVNNSSSIALLARLDVPIRCTALP